MSYPTLEQYNEALQFPQNALVDPILKSGKIATTGLGLPQALCGGFALTYTVTTPQKKFAVRCFHKQSHNLEQRYSAVSKKIKQLNSKYFLDFEFQKNGVKVAGGAYPVVKMAWASGETLASFIENNYKNKSSLENLNNSLISLSKFLASNGIAHGDIQPENIMVSNSGNTVQLIDYDGMYVDELKSIGSAELGQRNFQHPKRSEKNWDSTLDRFSFITLNLALRALQVDSSLWNKTQSDQAAILFRANDYIAPETAQIFRELIKKNEVAEDAKNFIAICKSNIEQTPSLDDFLSKRNIPVVQVKVVTSPAPNQAASYISAYPVIDAQNYTACLSRVGDVIELIGQIVEVKRDKTRHGKPYVFINFGHWQGRITKLNIWSEGLAVLKDIPTESWVGKWVSVIGLVDPAYVNKRHKYEHIAITITQNNQIKVISAQEASFRLKGSKGSVSSINSSIYAGIRGEKITIPKQGTASRNAAVLAQMKTTSSPHPSSYGSRGKVRGSTSGPNRYSYSSNRRSSSSNCFIATATYEDVDHPNVEFLRRYRDQVLKKYMVGRIFISIYYFLGPHFAYPVKKYSPIRYVVRIILDFVIKNIQKKINL